MRAELIERLMAVPEVEVAERPEVERAIDDTAAWLAGPEAARRLDEDPYWPKWDGPWWAMVALFELGRADRIPRLAIDGMVAALDRLPLHTFPIRADEWPPGVDRRRHTACHCAVGCIDSVLAACGVDVDRALPWFGAWYARYQLSDGGYNCDETAYLAVGECPSSMVGTIAPFEALVRRPPSEPCDRAAAMLVGRRLVDGSATVHNAEERAAAPAWAEPCTPRFYFYDHLRGAAALARWAVAHQRALPVAAIAPAVDGLLARAGDGVVRIGRVAWAGKTTWRAEDGWQARHPAATTALLAALPGPGQPSPALTRQWTALRGDLRALAEAGRLIA